MEFQIHDIARALQEDAPGYIAQCDAQYQAQLEGAANTIIANLGHSPVILLSGPSGSGKTTSAQKLEVILNRRGIGCHAVSMDDYFLSLQKQADGTFRPFNPQPADFTPEGDLDLESPRRLDMELLDDTFTKLSHGEPIVIPKFDFTRQTRFEDVSTTLALKKDEVVIFEGIHALNDDTAGRHPEATSLYVSARTDILEGDDVAFKHTWMRIARRAVRDHNFRNTDVAHTLSTWYNVRRGEKRYISPYKTRANVIIDSALGYEVPLFANYLQPLTDALKEVSPSNERYEEYHQLVEALARFAPLDPSLIPIDSLLREFMG